MNLGDLFMLSDSITLSFTWLIGTITQIFYAAGGYGSLALGSL